VLAIAASIHDDTALVDETTALQEEYRGDLDIQVVGIEHLSVGADVCWPWPRRGLDGCGTRSPNPDEAFTSVSTST